MDQVVLGVNEQHYPVKFHFKMANRHGLITGATGTGKTVSLQTIAEQFSKSGVSVFVADVKGDLSGIALPAEDNEKIKNRRQELKMTTFTPSGCPVVFWDIYGKDGHPLRTTISEMGPLLLGRILQVNEVQQGIVNAAFSLADDEGLLLLDLKDFRSLLDWMADHASELQSKYGHFNSASIGAIQRSLLTLQESGGDQFFGEPAFDSHHLFQKDSSGQGIINILDATQLIQDGRLYSTFLLWLLSELFEVMPEVGDLDKPKLVFFFDEAHALFDAAPKLLLEKIEQLVRLIRSKGVGVYFVTQSPLDIPDTILRQLGNRVQHALRAYTPKEQKAIRAVAETFRQNPNINLAEDILQLSVGEAFVSLLDENGTPAMVEKVQIAPPHSRIGAISTAERDKIIKQSPFYGMYDKPIDRESAHEVLEKRMQPTTAETIFGKSKGRSRQTMAEALAKSTVRSIGSQLGRQIIRGILGAILKNKS